MTTQSARVLAVASSGASNLRAAFSTTPASSTWDATANLPTFTNGTASAWVDIAYSPTLNLLVAIANGGDNNRNNVATSGDGGITWTPRAVPNQNAWTMNSVCWSDGLGLFCIVTSAGPTTTARVLTSSDGITWTVQSLPTATISLSGVAWSPSISGGMFCAVGDSNAIYTSTDGASWTHQTGPGTSQNWSSVCWHSGQSKFVSCANGGSGANNIMSSADGASWSQHSTGGTGYSWTKIAYSSDLDQMICIGGNTGVIVYSTAASVSAWTELATGLGGSPFKGVCWSHEAAVWAMVGDSFYYTSTASNTGWTSRSVPNANAWRAIIAIPSSVLNGFNIGTDYLAANTGTFSGGASGTVSVTTSQTNELVLLFVHCEGLAAQSGYTSVSSVSGGGLTWARRKQFQWRGGRNGAGSHNWNNLEVWWAHASAILSASTITVNVTGGTNDDSTICAVGVIGADSINPFDANASIPATANLADGASASTPSVSGVSTDQTKGLAYAVAAAPRAGPGSGAPATGWTLIANFTNGGGTDWSSQQSESENFSSAFSSATVTYGGGFTIQNWGIIADALVAPASETASEQASSSDFILDQQISSDRHVAEQASSSDRILHEQISSDVLEYQGWNPNDVYDSINSTVTNHNRTFTATPDPSPTSGEILNNGVRGSTSHSSGKWYFEINPVQTYAIPGGVGGGGGPIYRYAGIARASANLVTPSAADAVYDPVFGGLSGHNFGFLVDLDNHVLGIKFPDSGYVATYTIPPALNGVDVFPYFRSSSMLTDIVAINLGLTPFLYDVPHGYRSWNDLQAETSGAGQTFPNWSETDKNAGLTLSDADQTFTATGSNEGVRSYYGHMTGKWYAVFHNISAPGSNIELGVADSTRALSGTSDSANAGVLIGYGGVGVNQAGFNAFWASGGGSLTSGDLSGHDVEMAVDIETGEIWFRLDGAGDWNGTNGGPTADPATGVGGFNLRSLGWAWSELFVYGLGKTSGDTATVLLDPNAEPSSLAAYSPPTGFAWWNDEFASSEAVSEQASSSNKVLRDHLSSDHLASHVLEEMSSSNALLSDAQASDKRIHDAASSSDHLLGEAASSDKAIRDAASSSDRLADEQASSSNEGLSSDQASDIKAAKAASDERASSDKILAGEVSSDRLANRPPPVQIIIIAAN